jgi:two-component system, NarL family, invasion response regulator UvrY
MNRSHDVRILTVDDQAVFRATARDVVDATPGFTSVGEFGPGEEALTAIAEVDPELVLVDVRMAGMDGVEIARRIRSGGANTVVVLISVEDQVDLPEDIATCGAAAFVHKQDFGPDLLRRMWLVHGGGGMGDPH